MALSGTLFSCEVLKPQTVLGKGSYTIRVFLQMDLEGWRGGSKFFPKWGRGRRGVGVFWPGMGPTTVVFAAGDGPAPLTPKTDSFYWLGGDGRRKKLWGGAKVGIFHWAFGVGFAVRAVWAVLWRFGCGKNKSLDPSENLGGVSPAFAGSHTKTGFGPAEGANPLDGRLKSGGGGEMPPRKTGFGRRSGGANGGGGAPWRGVQNPLGAVGGGTGFDACSNVAGAKTSPARMVGLFSPGLDEGGGTFVPVGWGTISR